MKAVKGKLLKKLKTIKTIGYMKPDRILQVYASDGFFNSGSPLKSDTANAQAQPQLATIQEEPKKQTQVFCNQEPDIIDVSDLMKDLEDEEMDSGDEINDKENIRPDGRQKNQVCVNKNRKVLGSPEAENVVPLSEVDDSGYRKPDLDSGSLFDPNLLAAFEQAVMEVKAQEVERRARNEDKNSAGLDELEPPLKVQKVEEITDPLLEFEEKCPPGGTDSVVFYTTGLRGIRKTFEDCHSIRFLLESFRVVFFERDISMHSVYREELWRTLGGRVVPPRLFIRGRNIGGAEEVLRLHEQGKFKPLFEGIPMDDSTGPCEGCGGVRFIMCFNCNGSRKIVVPPEEEEEEDQESNHCPDCNENGVIVCPICC